MKNLSEEYIRNNCPHCNLKSDTYKYTLKETAHFYLVCDIHPITEGHLLIVPKEHVSCIGEYSKEQFEEFLDLYKSASQFLHEEYGSVGAFEHGKFGQTVFHSHVHLLPFTGKTGDIVPEGKKYFNPINNLSELKKTLNKDGGYLFFSIENKKWCVDPSLVSPRLFRDRFAKALGHLERGNWKDMHVDKEAMKLAHQTNIRTRDKWQSF